ncbi:hypothetical protein DEU56DRAFT_757330 [Suillus clintonianus]|uniref:uncharacterized protein n=1 Tax=Suillus clintonianus TaxID=1904413 RepID=UPI001B873A32|nr:uncharacterized protein DEU56DRAFT_762550 [Suillus clintonianus]XP_041200579.1 uncharacterized protein DEU56DRAFT_762545 [Suillus clintonianus]XP_041206902.1 uncharacterized protein DEU56DRAFT_757330 [Suillus clintonianus]KAG2108349.1 hypothetical protein DEU56DRAFT_762550 [Suillus clintonianus]KAG2108536.1 hypothetical protein DEU56DRAFT_762545 [Suillus clintonianus]KAG2132350.1 hypothetical protein DEU56DRAFT_757330 [Suillus clintonianus]
MDLNSSPRKQTPLARGDETPRKLSTPSLTRRVFCCGVVVEGCYSGRRLPEDTSFSEHNQPRGWMAHEECAKVVPETWVDGVETEMFMEKKGIWCGCDRERSARQKAPGAPIQCTKGKCAKSFHVGCARDGGISGIVYSILREVEKEVILVYPSFKAGVIGPSGFPTFTVNHFNGPVACSAEGFLDRNFDAPNFYFVSLFGGNTRPPQDTSLRDTRPHLDFKLR